MGTRSQMLKKAAKKDMAKNSQQGERTFWTQDLDMGGRESGKRPKKGKMTHSEFNIPSKVEFLISHEHPQLSVVTLHFLP